VDNEQTNNKPDELVPDPIVRREFNITEMTLHRWTNDPALDFPAKIKIRGHNFRSRNALEAFKERQIRTAIKQRKKEGSNRRVDCARGKPVGAR
jgi:hypothetical protein